MPNEDCKDYPFPLNDLVLMWTEYAARLLVASVGEDGTPAILPDEAPVMAAQMVGIAVSKKTIELFDASYKNPDLASRRIRGMTETVIERMKQANVAASEQNAEIYAARFGIKKK